GDVVATVNVALRHPNAPHAAGVADRAGRQPARRFSHPFVRALGRFAGGALEQIDVTAPWCGTICAVAGIRFAGNPAWANGAVRDEHEKPTIRRPRGPEII